MKTKIISSTGNNEKRIMSSKSHNNIIMISNDSY